MDADKLRCARGTIDNENEHTTWVEYYDGDELVHRSVDIVLKKGTEIQATEAVLG
jgi:hypothetical protein